MITNYKIPPRSKIVPVDGIKWAHRMVMPGTQLDPLATKLTPLVTGKATTVLGVLNGLAFQQWWEVTKSFHDNTHGSSVRTDFPDAWRNATAAVIHIEDECLMRRNWMKLLPRAREESSGRTLLLPNEVHLIVTVEIIGEHNQKTFALSGEIAVRADPYTLKEESDYLEPEDIDEFGDRFMDITNFIHADRFGYAKMMLLLEDTKEPGMLKIASSSVGSSYRIFQHHVVEHVIEVDQLWAQTFQRLNFEPI